LVMSIHENQFRVSLPLAKLKVFLPNGAKNSVLARNFQTQVFSHQRIGI